MHIIYKVLLYFCGHVCILNVLDFPYYNVLWNMITSFWYSHYCSVAKSCLTPCNPIESRMPKEKKKEKKRKESSMPGFLVLHYLWSLFKLTSIKSAMPSNHLKTIWFLFPFWFNSNETGIFFSQSSKVEKILKNLVAEAYVTMQIFPSNIHKFYPFKFHTITEHLTLDIFSRMEFFKWIFLKCYSPYS